MELSTAKALGKRQSLLIVALVPIKASEDNRTRMVIEVEVIMGKKTWWAKALVDSGTQANYIKRRIAVEWNLPTDGKKPPLLAAPSGDRIHLYASYTIPVAAYDALGDRRLFKTKLASCEFDMEGINLLLGYPWLAKVDPVISFVKGIWRHRLLKNKVEVVAAKQFARTTAADPYIYALTVIPAPMGLHIITAIAPTAEVLLPPKYANISHMFEGTAAGLLPEHHVMEHQIDLEPGIEPLYGPVYALSERELEILREYLESSQVKGWIRRSTSSAGAPIMFIPKKGGGLRLCVDYKGLNRVIIKNHIPLPLISKTLDRLKGAKVFTKLDLKDAYYKLRIREGNEWKTAFHTWYGYFEYYVMPFEFTNAPAIF